MSLKDARSQAVELIELIKRGIDTNASASDGSSDASVWNIGRLYEEYVQDMRARDCTEIRIKNVQDRLNRYLPHWKPLPITDIKRSMARHEHRRITEEHGGPSANMTLKNFRAAYNFALRVVDDPDLLQGKPPFKPVMPEK